MTRAGAAAGVTYTGATAPVSDTPPAAAGAPTRILGRGGPGPAVSRAAYGRRSPDEDLVMPQFGFSPPPPPPPPAGFLDMILPTRPLDRPVRNTGERLARDLQRILDAVNPPPPPPPTPPDPSDARTELLGQVVISFAYAIDAITKNQALQLFALEGGGKLAVGQLFKKLVNGPLGFPFKLVDQIFFGAKLANPDGPAFVPPQWAASAGAKANFINQLTSAFLNQNWPQILPLWQADP